MNLSRAVAEGARNPGSRSGARSFRITPPPPQRSASDDSDACSFEAGPRRAVAGIAPTVVFYTGSAPRCCSIRMAHGHTGGYGAAIQGTRIAGLPPSTLGRPSAIHCAVSARPAMSRLQPSHCGSVLGRLLTSSARPWHRAVSVGSVISVSP